jgi:hypothetical protein
VAPSLDAHGSVHVLLAGHQDCAGNPVDEATHREHLGTSAALLPETLGSRVDVLPAYVRLDGTVLLLDAEGDVEDAADHGDEV